MIQDANDSIFAMQTPFGQSLHPAVRNQHKNRNPGEGGKTPQHKRLW